MDEQKWKEIAERLKPALQIISDIVQENELDSLCGGFQSDGYTSFCHINTDTGVHYNIHRMNRHREFKVMVEASRKHEDDDEKEDIKC